MVKSYLQSRRISIISINNHRFIHNYAGLSTTGDERQSMQPHGLFFSDNRSL